MEPGSHPYSKYNTECWVKDIMVGGKIKIDMGNQSLQIGLRGETPHLGSVLAFK